MFCINENLQFTDHLKECQHAVNGVVKIHVRINPAVSLVLQTNDFVGNQRSRKPSTIGVNTFEELPREELNSEDAEYEPHQETNQQHVHYARKDSKQRVDNKLQGKINHSVGRYLTQILSS
mgnify:CR=1 FL=1